MASRTDSPGRETFGLDAEAYARARPAYPPELLDWLKDACGLTAESQCLEIGAGTGLASLPLLALPVGRLDAIEPDPRLAVRLSDDARAADLASRLRIHIARFEDTPRTDAAYDFAFAATSFHWLPRGKSLARLLAALKPGGWLALWWHVFHDPARPDPVDTALAPLFDGFEEGPRKSGQLATPFALDIAARLGELRAAGFTAAQHRLFRTHETFTANSLAALYATFSRVAVAPQATRERLLAELRARAPESHTREVQVSAFIARKP
jgi:SAM-dependent methyltransferase